MYTIWFERPLPEQHRKLLDGVALPAGPAMATPDAPFCALPGADAVIAGGHLNYDASMMDLAPGLRTICRTGIGYDNIDIAAATRRGIVVCNTPAAPTIGTAEHAIALMMAVARQLCALDRQVREGPRRDYWEPYEGFELAGARLGLVGMGRIGSRVARVARSLEMEVMVFDPALSDAACAEANVTRAASLDQLLSECDVVSLHLPLRSETRNLFGTRQFAQMKPGALFINTARGGLVDEEALEDALERGHLRGAGLDVFQDEPPGPDHPLLRRSNVVATPHIASATTAGKHRLWTSAIQQALDVLHGQKPAHVLNPDALA